MSNIPRSEYPRPQFVRDQWLNLNGTWTFEFDPGDSGFERGFVNKRFDSTIIVPFCPESDMSGIGDTDFHEAVWYRREIVIPDEWRGMDVLLNIGACDYDTTVWVNGEEAGRHRGGSASFSIDVTDMIRFASETTVVIRARDSRHDVQPRGKQSTWYANSECYYTRTTGIWQTVWLEPVPHIHLLRPRIVADIDRPSFTVTLPVSQSMEGYRVRVVLRNAEGRRLSSDDADASSQSSPVLFLHIPQQDKHLWQLDDPYLYGLDYDLIDSSGRMVDHVVGYAGLRSVSIRGQQFLINGKPVFQRLVLDQGYWPESLLTAPSDEALERDIILSKQAGFNGARLHQKVFEERYLYHADRLGYLVWGEFADWGCSSQGPSTDCQKPTVGYIKEWTEVVNRDLNHPSIIGWCPMNETYQVLTDRITDLDTVMQAMFDIAKTVDGTRPVLDSSGYAHRVRATDIYDAHDYTQDPDEFEKLLTRPVPFMNTFQGRTESVPYHGQPYFISEFGGIWWNPDVSTRTGTDVTVSWGYGRPITNIEDFYDRFSGLIRVLRTNGNMFGYCYTQLTDVFQEENGLYTFDRTPKFDMERIKAIQLAYE